MLEQLTDREEEVLALLAEGHPAKETARQLGIRLGTVRSHVYSIFNKLEVSSRAEAIRRYLDAKCAQERKDLESELAQVYQERDELLRQLRMHETYLARLRYDWRKADGAPDN